MLSLKFDGREDRILESSDSIKVESGSKLRVSVPENSSYQVLISDDQTDVILQVTNPDGSTYDVVLEGLASLYQSGDIVTQLLLDIEGEEMVVSNMTELFEALDATAAGEMDVQNRSFVDDNANIDPNRSAALDSDQERTDLEFTPLVVYGDGEPEPVDEPIVLNNVFVQLVTDSFSYEENGASLTHDIKLVNEAGVAVNLPIGETITFALTYTSIAGIDNVEDADFITKQIEVTITGDGTDEYNFSNIVADDFLNEGLEGYSVSIDAITGDSGYFDSVSIDVLHNDAEGIISDEEVGDTAYTLDIFAVVYNDSEIESYEKATTVYEDFGQGRYIVLAVDDSGNPLPFNEQPNTGTITVNIGSSSDTAIRDVDYDADNTTMNVSVGTSFTLDVVGDDILENSEVFTISLGNDWSEEYKYESVSYNNEQVITTINDNDVAKVSIEATDATAAEVLSGETENNGEFTVTLTKASDTPTVVSYTIAGTADATDDYTALSGTVTIPANTLSAKIDVNGIVDDSVLESSETVIVTLGSITSGDSDITIDATAKVATVTINDNDNAPEIDEEEFDIVENSAVGAYVGTVDAEDIDGDDITYTIENDPSGKFEIDASSGVITYVGTALDYETMGTDKFYTIKVGVSDGTNLTQQDFKVNILDLNESVTTAQHTIQEGSVVSFDYKHGNDKGLIVNEDDFEVGDTLNFGVAFTETGSTGTYEIGAYVVTSDGYNGHIPSTGIIGDSVTVTTNRGDLVNQELTFTVPDTFDEETQEIVVWIDGSSASYDEGEYTITTEVIDHTLVLDINDDNQNDDISGDDIDMAQFLADVEDFEPDGSPLSLDEIDITTGDHILSNLSVSDFIAMTDTDNTLEITGDSGDRVELDSLQWKMALNDDSNSDGVIDDNSGIFGDGDGFVTYTDIATQALTLLIDENIDVDLVP